MATIKSRVASRLRTTEELDEIIAAADALSGEITRKQEAISRAWRVLLLELHIMSESCSGNACEKKQREWQPTVRNKVTYGAAWARGVFANRRARKPASQRNRQG